MEEFIQKFLDELRLLDEPTKKKVLIISTIVIMIVVIYFWVVYFNGVIASTAQPALAAQTGAGFWASAWNDLAFLSQSVWSGLRHVTAMFQNSRQYIIQGNK